MSIKAGRKDAAAVDDQQVSGTQQFGKVSKFAVFKPTGETRQMQHTGVAALGQRLLRNQLFREMKIKVGNQHPAIIRTCRAKRDEKAFDRRKSE
jgi:hypothetical protein